MTKVLAIVWGFVFGYFFLLWYATASLAMGVAGTIIFVLFALKVTVRLLLEARRASGHQSAIRPDPSQPVDLRLVKADWTQPGGSA